MQRRGDLRSPDSLRELLALRIRVLAPGYKTSTGILEDRTQDPRFHEENPDPPPIVIRMERDSQDQSSE